MLESFGVPVLRRGRTVQVDQIQGFPGQEIWIPGDISSAAFFIGAAAILEGSNLRVLDVALNPTRLGFVETLIDMGADIEVSLKGTRFGEDYGDIEVRGTSPLRGVTVGGDIVPRLIDEIPILAVTGCFAEGETVIKNARELRVKETDRIRALTHELRQLGADVQEKEDGMVIAGGRNLEGTESHSWGDHRMAMALVVANLASGGGGRLSDSECISVSFPDFRTILSQVLTT